MVTSLTANVRQLALASTIQSHRAGAVVTLPAVRLTVFRCLFYNNCDLNAAKSAFERMTGCYIFDAFTTDLIIPLPYDRRA